ncbi:hypothetical protein GUJ93_ZPchr0005g15819 [Zizania palustris]|uniref:Uncharacterized protein n=1 Tax=Zizania palustris TaxID=103762 RepID=A0A8J5T3E5_ZIZPA|nr:hypothetical protein GUJ93_ZPchr0005g15819 [Zizania palustris]
MPTPSKPCGKWNSTRSDQLPNLWESQRIQGRRSGFSIRSTLYGGVRTHAGAERWTPVRSARSSLRSHKVEHQADGNADASGAAAYLSLYSTASN